MQRCSVSQWFWPGRAKEMVKVVLFTSADFSEMETVPSSPSEKKHLDNLSEISVESSVLLPQLSI